MKTNVIARGGPKPVTHEGTTTLHQSPYRELRRAALLTLLFEDTFYEGGAGVAARIASLVPKVSPVQVADLAVEARTRLYLRHLPLFLVRELARIPGNGSLVAATLAQVIERPDELGEYLALYFKDDKAIPLSAGSKRGLAAALKKFDEATLAKYDRDAVFKLRDVLRLVHARADGGVKKRGGTYAKPTATPGQGEVWGRVISRTLKVPDTWEVALSSGADKKATFERLLREKKLGGLAFLRNLRNMVEAHVDEALIRERFSGGFKYVMPFRFIAAARHAPRFEDLIEAAMLRACEGLPVLRGTTALIVDTSPSMWQDKISAKSELTRFDAAAALAILAREMCESVHIWAFNSKAYEIRPRRGFALRDDLAKTQGGSSCGGLAVAAANARGYDRIIVLTDGQWHVMRSDDRHYGMLSAGDAKDVAPAPLTGKAYMVNVAPYQYGYTTGHWQSVDGWSERILDFIAESEQLD